MTQNFHAKNRPPSVARPSSSIPNQSTHAMITGSAPGTIQKINAIATPEELVISTQINHGVDRRENPGGKVKGLDNQKHI